MNKSPAFQLYPSEFLSDENVVMMTNQEVGCYIKLLCYCWQEKSIPSDIKKIAKLCKEDDPTMAQLWLSLSSCFSPAIATADRLINPRLERERKKQEEFKKERSESGKKGAEARYGKAEKSSSSAIAQVSGEPMANDSSLSPSPFLSPIDKVKDKGSPPCIPPKGKPPTNTHKRACGIPTDFSLSDSLRSWSIKTGPALDITAELDQFTDHHLAKGSLMKNWDAAFRTWIRNAIKFSKGGNNSRPKTSIGVAATYKKQLAEEETGG